MTNGDFVLKFELFALVMRRGDDGMCTVELVDDDDAGDAALFDKISLLLFKLRVVNVAGMFWFVLSS